MFDRKNLIVLVYASNPCYTTVLELDDPQVLKADVLIDEKKGTWARPFDHPYGNLKIHKIGEMHRCADSARGGAIGVYDRTNSGHLKAMVRAAQEATEDSRSFVEE